jgi:site-specific DNA-methyltransferase (adenine-specific)
MEINKIYQGDCIEILEKEIDPGSINLIFADPPYNLSGGNLKWEGNKTGGDWYMMNEEWDRMSDKDYFRFTNEWVKGCYRVLKKSGSIYISCTYHNIAEVIINLKHSGFKINNVITWYKTNAMPNMTKRVFTHTSEFVVWAVKGKNWTFNYQELKKINPERQKNGLNKQMRDVWTMPLVQGKERIRGEDRKALHPTQKPEEMLKRIIIASSDKGDLILDPFLGSGTTAVIAKNLGRNWVGIEKEKKYIEASKKRLGLVELIKR